MLEVYIAILGLMAFAWFTGCASELPAPPLMIATSTVANGTVGTSYQQTIQATGGTAPFSWSLSAGTLPAGLSLGSTSSESLVISGVPVALQTSANCTISVTDSRGNTDGQQYTISI